MDKREWQKIEKDTNREIYVKGTILQAALAQLGFYVDGRNWRSHKYVHFDKIDITDAGGTFFHVDLSPKRWIPGKTADDLMKPEIVSHLSLVFNRQAEIVKSVETGLWIYIHGPSDREAEKGEKIERAPWFPRPKFRD